MNKRLVITALTSLYVIALAFYWFGLGGKVNTEIRDVLYLLTSFTGVIAGAYALKQYGFAGVRSRSLLLLTFGIGYWFIGELLWDYYIYLLHANPFPSVADLFYLNAYPLFFFGFVNEIFSARVNWKKLNRAILFLLVIASLAIALVVFNFGVYQAYDVRETLFVNSIAIGYGLGDLVLIVVNMLLVVLALDHKGGSLSRTWLIIFVSFILSLISDILFATHNAAYKTNIGFYKDLLDSFWMLSYVLFAYGLFSIGFSISDANQRISQLSASKK